MITDMLYSINQEYQIFALENINNVKYKEHYLQIAEIFRASTPLVRSILAKQITSKFKYAPDLQSPFWESFEVVDSGSRSLLVQSLGDAPDYVYEILSGKLSAMSKNQLKVFLNHLVNKEYVNPIVKQNIEAFANMENETYAYLAQEFLEGQK